MQYNGTYFYPQQPAPAPPALLPSLPAPHSSIPHQQMPVIFTNPWEGWQLPYTPASVGYTAVTVNPSAWPGAALGYNDALSGNRTPALQHFVPQFARPQGLPMAEYPEEAIPRQMSMAMTMANYALRPSEEPSPSNPLNLPPPKTRAYSTPADEFPYAPPKEQRNGHARRISVSTKSVNREAMDALGLDSPTTESASGRLPWQTHSDRLARRVSAHLHSCGLVLWEPLGGDWYSGADHMSSLAELGALIFLGARRPGHATSRPLWNVVEGSTDVEGGRAAVLSQYPALHVLGYPRNLSLSTRSAHRTGYHVSCFLFSSSPSSSSRSFPRIVRFVHRIRIP